MHRTVRDVMTKAVLVVDADAPIKEVARTIADYRVSALPVVDGESRLVGIISETDVLLKEDPGFETDRHLFEGHVRRVERRKAAGLVAEHLMTTPVVTIGPDASAREAARRMHEERVKHLVVTNGHERILGIVSGSDLVRVLLRSDEGILREVEEVLARRYGLERDATRVRVTDGVVRIDGEVESRSLVPLLLGEIRAVEGVVGVDPHLAWKLDDTVPPVGLPFGAALMPGR